MLVLTEEEKIAVRTSILYQNCASTLDAQVDLMTSAKVIQSIITASFAATITMIGGPEVQRLILAQRLTTYSKMIFAVLEEDFSLPMTQAHADAEKEALESMRELIRVGQLEGASEHSKAMGEEAAKQLKRAGIDTTSSSSDLLNSMD